MYYVYSTATCSGTYCEYQENGSADLAVVKRKPNGQKMQVTIRGGHGVKPYNLLTPYGIMTPVSDEDMAWLKENPAFKRHMAAGFITYDKKKVDPAKKAANMSQKDGSAPLTPKEFEESQYSSDSSRVYKPSDALVRQHGGIL